MFSRYGTLLSYVSGAKKRVGFYRYYQEGLYTGDFLSHKVYYNLHIHTAQAFLSLAHALEAPHGQMPLTKMSVDSLDEHALDLPVFRSSAADRAQIRQDMKIPWIEKPTGGSQRWWNLAEIKR